MKKVDPAVKKETLFILWMTLLMSIIMEAVFLAIGKWDITVLYGNLLGEAVSVGNFFLMGLTIQSALGKSENDAKATMKVSQMLRMLLIFAALIVGYLVPVFHTVAVVIPFIFPRIAIFFRPLFDKKKEGGGGVE